MQAWDGWTPPVTTSVASKALSIKDHAFAPAAGTAEVAGWTPVTSLATRTNAHGQQSMQTSQQTRPSPWHDRATIAYPVTHHSVPTVQVSHEDDVDNWRSKPRG